MSAAPQLEIKSVVVCDDARREDNGKYILIGVYLGSIVAFSFPLQLGLCFFVEAEAKAIGLASIDFKLVGNGDVDLIEGKIQFGIEQKGLLGFPIKTPTQTFPVAMSLSFLIRQEGGEWQTIKTIPMVRGTFTPPAVVKPN